MSSIKISVVIPTYNRASQIRKAIESVLNQTYPVDEILVIDDGSTDNTISVLADYIEDKRINFVRQANAGPSAARNNGIRQARNEVIAFLDSDDTWTQNKIEIQAKAMQSSEAILCFTNWSDTQGNIGFSPDSNDHSIIDSPLEYVASTMAKEILVQTCLINRAAIIEAGLFDIKLKIAEDTKLLFSIAKRMGKFVKINSVCLVINTDRDATSLTQRGVMKYERIHAENVLLILKDVGKDHENLSTFAKTQLLRSASFYQFKIGKIDLVDNLTSSARKYFIASVFTYPWTIQSVKACLLLLLGGIAKPFVFQRD